MEKEEVSATEEEPKKKKKQQRKKKPTARAKTCSFGLEKAGQRNQATSLPGYFCLGSGAGSALITHHSQCCCCWLALRMACTAERPLRVVVVFLQRGYNNLLCPVLGRGKDVL